LTNQASIVAGEDAKKRGHRVPPDHLGAAVLHVGLGDELLDRVDLDLLANVADDGDRCRRVGVNLEAGMSHVQILGKFVLVGQFD